MDYGYSERRKNKNDKRAKARFNKYKRGGKFRATDVNIADSKQSKEH